MRTCTIMIYTNGTRSIYDVMRGPISKNGKIFYAHKAEIVGQYEVIGKAPDYRAMTAAYATDTAPAVYWQA